MTEFQKLKIDLKINKFILSRIVVIILRLERMNVLTRILVKPLRLLILNMSLNIEISHKVKLGEGIRFPHPYNIVINQNSQIGSYVTIFHNVTLGEIDYSEGGAPIVDDFVFIGTSSNLIGGIRVGGDSILSANSLVTKNIPEGSFYKLNKLYKSRVSYKKFIMNKIEGLN